jgi:hypothetical protein
MMTPVTGLILLALCFPSAFVFLSTTHFQQVAASQSKPTTDAQSKIDEIIASLPQGSSIRRTLEDNHFGSGIHEPWMDDMKRAGVKLAILEVHGVWHTATRFNPQATTRIIYRKDYDGPGVQITDAGELEHFEKSGLEARLQRAAFHESAKAIWIGVDAPPKDGDACIVTIYLFDEEWLADSALRTNLPGIGRYDPREFPLGYAAAAGDLLAVRQQLSTQQFSEHLLDIALFEAVHYPLDNTDVISALLKAGANVNAVRPGGRTPLMDAVALVNLANAGLLLNSGADISRKTRDGLTAYSLAMQQIKRSRENGGIPAESLSGMLELLTPSGSEH